MFIYNYSEGLDVSDTAKYEQAETIRKDLEIITDWKHNELKHFLKDPSEYDLEDIFEYIEHAFKPFIINGKEYTIENVQETFNNRNSSNEKTTTSDALAFIGYKKSTINLVKKIASKYMVDNKTMEDLDKWIKATDSLEFIKHVNGLIGFLSNAVL